MKEDFNDISQIDEAEIEDKPWTLDLSLVIRIVKKSFVLGLCCMLIGGILTTVLRREKSTVQSLAQATLYVPPYTSRQQGNRIFVISNNLGQIENMINLLPTKKYQDIIASKLGVASVSEVGQYWVTREKDTELLTINARAENVEKAEQLCGAVLEVMKTDIGRAVSINDTVMVDSIRGKTVVNASSQIKLFIHGMEYGVVLYFVYLGFKVLTDRRFHTKKEVEEYLELPVLCVLPQMKKKKEV